MDYKLENENLGLTEKNKKLFTDLTKDKMESIIDEDEAKMNNDTFKAYETFMTEKDGLLEIIEEMVKYSLIKCGELKLEQLEELKSIKKQSDLVNYKNRIIMVLENYQEQPGLLDPILSIIVPNIMNNSLYLIRSLLSKRDEDVFLNLQCLYQIVYILCKVRGYTTITKFFSSEVHVFEPVISFLLTLDQNVTDNWFLLYVLLLWTSILGLIPFDIETIDSNNIITISLFEYYKKLLEQSGNLRDIAAYALSKFLTRPDVIKKGLLNNFINYSITCLHNPNLQINIFLILGLMSALCEIFKHGLPKDLSDLVGICVNKILKHNFDNFIKNSGVFNKFLSKLSQRLGLVLLKPKFQQWRYQIKFLNLMNNKSQNSQNFEETQNEEDSLDYDIDFEILESLIDFLLTGLNHKEYIVRWSSAKGLGRLCERLTKEMVDDILHNVLDLFEKEGNEYSWQGACLCIAELCKRGMVLPDKLGVIVTYMEKALIFEVNKGTFCSGSNVRDSACYVVWALARAYSREVMRPFVFQIAKSLLLTILFDKEVNCRRAASAAFQEHVGRQGYFPHGIEIITEADYFTLGNRNNCYLNISTFIAQYPDYYISIVDYLALNRLVHVENNIRQLTAEALGLLVPFNPDYFVNNILPKLVDLCSSKNLHVRHGAIVGIGYILVGLSGNWDFEHKAKRIRKKIIEGMNSKEKQVLEDSEYRKMFEEKYDSIKYINNMKILPSNLIELIINIPNNLEQNGLYRGKGAEIMRTAVNSLIRLVSVSNARISSDVLLNYFDVLIDNIKHPNLDIQKEACESLKLLNQSYSFMIRSDGQEENKNIYAIIEQKFLHILKLSVNDESIYVTKGYTMSIPYFDVELIIKNYSEVLECLYINCKIKKLNNNDAETRKYALESLTWLSIKLLENNTDLIVKDLDKIMVYLLEGLEDYEIDKKLGDVGSKVREASIYSMTCLLLEIYKYTNLRFVFEKFVFSYLKGLLKQIGEKMGKMRLAAGDSLQKFFFELKDEDSSYMSIHIPNYEELKLIFLEDICFNDKDEISNTKWLEPAYAYKRIINIIMYESYTFSLFEGLIISIGGITEDTHKYSLEELDYLITSQPIEKQLQLIEWIYQHTIDIFAKYPKEDRVIEPLYNTLTNLLTKISFIDNRFIDKIDLIQKCCAKENFESNNIYKVLSSVDIFYNMLFFTKEDTFNILYRCLRSLLILITHKYPVVRKKAAEKLYLFLMGLDDPSLLGLEYEDLENISIILTDKNWAEAVAKIKEYRNNIAKMLKVNLENIATTKK